MSSTQSGPPPDQPGRIVSTRNPRVQQLVRLRQRRQRDRSGTFLIEGYRELGRALEAGVEIIEMYAAPELFLGSNEPGLLDRAAASGATVFELAEAPFRRVSYRDRPEGLLAVARQFPTELDRLSPPHPALLLVVEGIEKPGNLGTILRTADAAGAHGVVVADPTTDPFNPNVVRASLGCLFTVPLAVGTTGDSIEHLHSIGVRAVATTPDAEISIWEVDLREPVAVVVGSEQFGLSQDWQRAADHRVSIPMAGSADSLNAAMAAGVALFEAVRQRRAGRSE